jgi:hypothetical protein
MTICSTILVVSLYEMRPLSIKLRMGRLVLGEIVRWRYHEIV